MSLSLALKKFFVLFFVIVSFFLSNNLPVIFENKDISHFCDSHLVLHSSKSFEDIKTCLINYTYAEHTYLQSLKDINSLWKFRGISRDMIPKLLSNHSFKTLRILSTERRNKSHHCHHIYGSCTYRRK